MVDAAVTDVQMAKNLLKHGVSKVIVGTETLQSKLVFQEIVNQVGIDKIIVSFDIKNDKVLTHPNFDGPTDLIELHETFRAMGATEFIFLDLTRVGSAEGVNVGRLKKTLDMLGGEGVYVGGGIRSVEDLLKLNELNVLGVLFVTALHLGKITVNDLKRVGLL
jgi:phosphoribosylformimino-5-aminoimidazole carboxamide ribotide isomerase